MKTWLTTDTHFGHANLTTKYKARPEGFTQMIINAWRSEVRDDDLVIHLGDVVNTRLGSVKWLMRSLPGRKILVLGNHDEHKRHEWWMEHGFNLACESLIYKGVLLTHKPHITPLPPGASINIHGHCHNDTHHGPGQRPSWCVLLALEKTDYRPVLFETAARAACAKAARA